MEIKRTVLPPYGGSREEMFGGTSAWTYGRGVIGSPAAEDGEVLYEFSSITFNPGGAEGSLGPTLSQAIDGAGNPPWATNFIRMPDSQGVIHWTVPKTGTYSFDVFGAASADSINLGGRVCGTIMLNKSDVIKLAVGQRGLYGGSNSWSGGGGSFVSTVGNVPLFVAGGGGGNNESFRFESQGGWLTSPLMSNGSGGTNNDSNHTGGAGGGFYQNGMGSGNISNGVGGTSFVNGAFGGNGDSEVPGSAGGFGAGGGGGGYGDGGGGGYVGGNATSGDSGVGDGGTNYFGVGITQVSNEAGVKWGFGQIIITHV